MPSEQQRSNTPEKDKDRWRTPPWLYAWLTDLYGPFDIDLTADKSNALCEKYFTKRMNALSKAWRDHGRTGFMNPPYSEPGPFVKQAHIEALEGFSTVMILPTHRNQIWAALARHATERIEFEGRVNFYNTEGTEMTGALGGTQVLYFRAHDLGYTRTRWVKTLDIKSIGEKLWIASIT